VSENKAIIDCIKEYFKTCPHLSELAKINVDYLNIESKDCEYWSIEQNEAPIILGENVIGTKTHRQCQFVIASRAFFNPLKDTQNIENLHLFEKIAEWVYQNNKKRIYPELNDNEIPTSLEVITGGFLYGTDRTNTIARYQMNCKLLYDKEER
jgi:hypothetical protein